MSTRLLSSEPWSITFAKSTRSSRADDVIQSISRSPRREINFGDTRVNQVLARFAIRLDSD
jgi:hypothetical protein